MYDYDEYEEEGVEEARMNSRGFNAVCEQAPPSFAKLIADGTVVPDEGKGPYDLASYHSNITGKHRGYKAGAGFDEWYAENKEIMWPSTRAGRPRP